MTQIKLIICSLFFVSIIAQADESNLDKAKNSAQHMWEKTKVTTSEIVDTTRAKASEFGEKASDFGSKASKNAKETGEVVWDKMKEAGEATADSARKGASKIRSFVGQHDCQEDSLPCKNTKE